MKRVIPWLVVAVVMAFAVWRRSRRTPPSARTGMALPAVLRGDTTLIAAREIRQRLRGRLFRIVTLLMLAGVAAAIVIPALTKGGTPLTRVGVVGAMSGAERAALDSAGRASNTRVQPVSEPDAATSRRALLAGRISLAVVDASEVVAKKEFAASDTSTTARLARAVAAVLGEQQAFRAAGLTAPQVSQLAQARPLPVVGLQPTRAKGAARSAAVIGVILLFVLLSQYNTWTLIGVMEEKSSRVVEVLLATVRPIQLLAGKVLGIGLLVLAQAGLVVGFALALGAAVGSNLLHGAGPVTVVSTLLWLVLGYAFYSWVYAAAGSMAERQDQVQSLAIPLAIPMLVGYIFALTVATNGTTSTFFDVLAYLPPTAPFAMPVLIAINAVAWWQVTLAALISVASTIAVARLAAVIYRRAVLRTGHRVRMREVMSRQPA
jgi:ABC-2 type transport system permease protein